MRPAALLALAPLLMRSSSSAFFRSPPASVSAFLHSIIPSPVSSRSSFTRAAVISAIRLIHSFRLQIEKRGLAGPLCLAFMQARSVVSLVIGRIDFDEFVARGRHHFLHRL